MTIRIQGREIGPGAPAYVVAELSGNHNGDIERAVAILRAAAAAGADAIKLQTYTPDMMTLPVADDMFVVPGDGPWGGRHLHDLYAEAHTPWEWHRRLFDEAAALGVAIFSTPFDATAVDFLEELDAPAYKVSSFELADDALLRRVSATRKPVILSTGMASLEEIAHAVTTLRTAGVTELVLLKCTSAYPASDASMNLEAIGLLGRIFDCPVGLSDHSLGTTAAVVAVTLGASFIEKHVTLSRSDGGVDSHFSLEPDELKELVHSVRRAEAMRGRPSFGPGLEEEGNLVFRRSLFVVRDIAVGEPFTSGNVRAIRPGHGLSPRHLDVVLGRRASRAVAMGTPLSWELIAGGQTE